MNKEETRKAVLSALSEIPEEERHLRDKRISDTILSLREFKKAECIFSYVGTDYEIRTDKIIEEALKAGKRVAVPLCYGKGVMDAIEIKSLGELRPGRYNIPEPPRDGRKVSPCELDAVIVPGVAFDREGRRLGRGGGYYDRFLKLAGNAVLIAPCREENLLREVPVEDHDQAVDIIITETDVLKRK